MDGFGLTPDDKEELMRIKNQHSSGSVQPEYEPVKGYEHLNVFQTGKRYKVEYGDISISISANRIDHIGLSNFIEDYLSTKDFHEAHRLNYKGKSQKAEELIPILETDEDLTQDLSRLAKQLDPRD